MLWHWEGEPYILYQCKNRARIPFFLPVDTVSHCSTLFLTKLFAGNNIAFHECKIMSLYSLKERSVSISAEALHSPELEESRGSSAVLAQGEFNVSGDFKKEFLLWVMWCKLSLTTRLLSREL